MEGDIYIKNGDIDKIVIKDVNYFNKYDLSLFRTTRQRHVENKGIATANCGWGVPFFAGAIDTLNCVCANKKITEGGELHEALNSVRANPK